LGYAQSKWDGEVSTRFPAVWQLPSADQARSDKFSARDGSAFGALAVGFSAPGLPLRAELEYVHLGKVSDSENRVVYPTTVQTGMNVYARQRLDGQTLFANVYWDFRNSSPITPYLNVGIGAAFLKLKVDYWHDDVVPIGQLYTGGKRRSETNFAWNLGAGVGWQISKQLTLDAGYRYVDLGNISSGDHALTHVSAGNLSSVINRQKAAGLRQHQLSVGLRYAF
jgi:opacity protein-like surface antigen